MRYIESSSLVAAGFGTLYKQVAGFHRAVPSTTLDKAYMQFLKYYTHYFVFVKIFFRFLLVFAEFIHNSVMDIFFNSC